MHGFGASALLEVGASIRFRGLHGLELLAGFEVGLASSQGGVVNLVVPGSSEDGVGWALCLVRGFGLWGSWE